MQGTQATTAQLAHELRETLGPAHPAPAGRAGPAVPQLAVLGRLDREGPASVSDLAAAERMRPQSMAQTVRDLEAAGLVSRRPDPDDGRRVLRRADRSGLETLNATRARREGWLTQTLDRELGAGEREQLRRALALLGRVADA